MKIMKRSSSNVSSNSSGGANPKNVLKKNSLSDKEKAYAEARARIFQDEQQQQPPPLAPRLFPAEQVDNNKGFLKAASLLQKARLQSPHSPARALSNTKISKLRHA
jgi:hypothetical protein